MISIVALFHKNCNNISNLINRFFLQHRNFSIYFVNQSHTTRIVSISYKFVIKIRQHFEYILSLDYRLKLSIIIDNNVNLIICWIYYP